MNKVTPVNPISRLYQYIKSKIIKKKWTAEEINSMMRLYGNIRSHEIKATLEGKSGDYDKTQEIINYSALQSAIDTYKKNVPEEIRNEIGSLETLEKMCELSLKRLGGKSAYNPFRS